MYVHYDLIRTAALSMPAAVGILSAEVITPTDTPSLSVIVIAVSGIAATAALVWRGRGELDRIHRGIERLQEAIDKLPCIRGDDRCTMHCARQQQQQQD